MRIKTGQLLVQDGAEISVSSLGSGDAGDIDVAALSILLDNRGILRAESAFGNAGNIKLKTYDFLMRRNSQISITASGSGNSGEISIDTNVLIALENSDFILNLEGQGGNFIVNTQVFFLSPDSDIIIRSGQRFRASNTEFYSRGLIILPPQLIDVSNLIATDCPAEAGPDSSTFVYAGRGGTPPTPTEALNSDAVLVDLGTPIQTQENRATTAPVTKPTLVAVPTIEAAPTQLVEAQGWVISDNGDIVLSATPATATTHIPWLTAADCHTAKTQS